MEATYTFTRDEIVKEAAATLEAYAFLNARTPKTVEEMEHRRAMLQAIIDGSDPVADAVYNNRRGESRAHALMRWLQMYIDPTSPDATLHAVMAEFDAPALSPRERAEKRVEASEALSKHAETIFYDWEEGDSHLEWIAEAPEAEIVSWAEAVEHTEEARLDARDEELRDQDRERDPLVTAHRARRECQEETEQEETEQEESRAFWRKVASATLGPLISGSEWYERAGARVRASEVLAPHASVLLEHDDPQWVAEASEEEIAAALEDLREMRQERETNARWPRFDQLVGSTEYSLVRHVSSGEVYVQGVGQVKAPATFAGQETIGMVIEAAGPLHYSEFAAALAGDFDNDPELLEDMAMDADIYIPYEPQDEGRQSVRQLWAHLTGEVYVVEFSDGQLVGAAGPLHHSEFERTLSGDFDEDMLTVDWMKRYPEQFKLYEPATDSEGGLLPVEKADVRELLRQAEEPAPAEIIIGWDDIDSDRCAITLYGKNGNGPQARGLITIYHDDDEATFEIGKNGHGRYWIIEPGKREGDVELEESGEWVHVRLADAVTPPRPKSRRVYPPKLARYGPVNVHLPDVARDKPLLERRAKRLGFASISAMVASLASDEAAHERMLTELAAIGDESAPVARVS